MLIILCCVLIYDISCYIEYINKKIYNLKRLLLKEIQIAISSV